ncbi:MAG: hypothetical protein HQ510_12020 [Candidatus Marinimicrobia bacterium]|nr:hypothetical protein [Candidatus Neomarinimicrobiota bacterium]
MKPYYFACILSLGVCFAIETKHHQLVTKTTHTIFLGKEKVWVDIYERPGINVTLLNLHDNENTSAEAGNVFIQKYGGRLVELRHGRGREVVVRLDSILHRFDPNRMFSDVGLRASLDYYHSKNEKVDSTAIDFREKVLNIFDVHEGMTVISLHNNTSDKMTINDYRPGEWYGEYTKELFINPEKDPDNFFVVTQDNHFAALSLLDYNVALRTQNPIDSGMLIDYLKCVDVICVTIETEHGKLAEQIEMLEAFRDILLE